MRFIAKDLAFTHSTKLWILLILAKSNSQIVKNRKKYTPYFLTLNIFSTTVKNCEKVLERFLFSSKVVPSILIPILLYYNCTF